MYQNDDRTTPLSEYKFIDSAFGGAKNRNNVNDLSKLKLQSNQKSALSQYSGSERISKSIRKSQDQSGGYIYYDIKKVITNRNSII